LKEFKLIPQPNAGIKYPSEDAGKFLLSYLLCKFPPFDVEAAYLNFDLKASILNDINGKGLRDLSKGKFKSWDQERKRKSS
jgi:hypothetical protein